MEELYKSAFSNDTVCCRFSMAALANILQDPSKVKPIFEGLSVENIERQCKVRIEEVTKKRNQIKR